MSTPRKQGAGEASSPGLYGILRSGLSKVRRPRFHSFLLQNRDQRVCTAVSKVTGRGKASSSPDQLQGILAPSGISAYWIVFDVC